MSSVDSKITKLEQDCKRIIDQLDRLSVLVAAMYRIVIVDMGSLELCVLDDYIDDVSRKKQSKFDLQEYLKEKLSLEKESLKMLIKDLKK